MTKREEIVSYLESKSASIDTLALYFEATPKVISSDLEHIFLSLKRNKKRLLMSPAYCLNKRCEFVFSTKRKRLADPGKCPQCHSERIHPQLFKI